MIVSERYTEYINSLGEPLSDELEALFRRAREEDVPVIRRETQSFLRVILKQKCPRNILEVGTAIGFSALFMAECTPAETQITTIEKYEKRIPLAKENFRSFGQEERISLLEGDAADILPTLESGAYDLIFMDAAKGQYIHFLPQVKRLLTGGGILISDNVLQDGQLIESRFAVPRRDRTIHERMREYLWALTHDESLTTSVLTVGDGIAISLRDAKA